MRAGRKSCGGRWRGAALALALTTAAPADFTDDAPEMLHFTSPTSGDLPIGRSRIGLEGRALLPGDRVEVFVDGRRAGIVEGPPWTLEWNFGETPRQYSITAVVMRDGAEVVTARVKTRFAGVVASVSAHAVGLSLAVTDRRGRYVSGLLKDQFTLLEDNRPQQIDTLEATDSKLSVVVVLDLSESMVPKIDDARASILRFLDALGPGDEVSLLTFNSRVLGITPFSAVRSAVKHAIRDVVPSGETALYDSTAAALKALKSAKGRKTVVIFSDGEDNRSRLGANQVIEMASAGEATIFAVAQAGGESRVLKVYLERMAEATGGRSYFVDNAKSLAGAFEKVLRELKSQYFITYQPTNKKPKTWRRVEVRTRNKELVVRARHRYFFE